MIIVRGLGAILAPLGPLLGASWADLGSSWAPKREAKTTRKRVQNDMIFVIEF